MKDNTIFIFFGTIIGVAFLLWLVDRARRNNVVVVEDNETDRIVEQPIVEPIVQQPVYTQPVFQQNARQFQTLSNASRGARVNNVAVHR